MIEQLEFVRGWWRWITVRRQKSHLRALQIAKRSGIFAIFPIFGSVTLWHVLHLLPALLLWTIGYLLDSSPAPFAKLMSGVIQGFAFFICISVWACWVPWIFHWYFIAVALMCGRTGMANRKENELIKAIQKAEAASGAV
jgi:hypothetical protein